MPSAVGAQTISLMCNTILFASFIIFIIVTHHSHTYTAAADPPVTTPSSPSANSTAAAADPPVTLPSASANPTATAADLPATLLSPSATPTAAAAGPPVTLPSAEACSDKLVAFSTCLPYVAVSSNNLTNSPPPPQQCCDDVSVAFGDGSAICLCYFVLQPKMLGFALDSSRLLSLTAVCPLKDRGPKPNFSLQSLCSESVVLPPLQSITGSSNSKPRNIGAESPQPPSR